MRLDERRRKKQELECIQTEPHGASDSYKRRVKVEATLSEITCGQAGRELRLVAQRTRMANVFIYFFVNQNFGVSVIIHNVFKLPYFG